MYSCLGQSWRQSWVWRVFRWWSLFGKLTRQGSDFEGVQEVMRGRERMQEHHLLQNEMVHPLEHVVHQDEVQQEGGCVDDLEVKRPRHCQRHQTNFLSWLVIDFTVAYGESFEKWSKWLEVFLVFAFWTDTIWWSLYCKTIVLCFFVKCWKHWHVINVFNKPLLYDVRGIFLKVNAWISDPKCTFLRRWPTNSNFLLRAVTYIYIYTTIV